VTDRQGKPVTIRLSAGQRHEAAEAVPLLEQTLERLWPEAVAGDRGYSTHPIRNWLLQREIEAVIPWRSNERGPKRYDRTAYRDCGRVELTINRLKRYRRIATRYEKLAATYLAMVTIACILEWL
jgi:transposase